MRTKTKPDADRILEACAQAFAELGYGATSLRQLMSAAGVSTTAFYARFESKEAVVAALSTRLFDALYADAPKVLDQVRDLASGIDAGVNLLCEHFTPKKKLVRLILSEAGAVPAAVESRRRAYDLLAGFLAARLGSKAVLAWPMIGALEIQVVRWAVWNELTNAELKTQLRMSARAVLRLEPR